MIVYEYALKIWIYIPEKYLNQCVHKYIYIAG